jgi:hypothetical protein
VPADFNVATFTSLLPQGCSLANKDKKTWGKVVPRVLAQRFVALRLTLDRKKVRVIHSPCLYSCCAMELIAAIAQSCSTRAAMPIPGNGLCLLHTHHRFCTCSHPCQLHRECCCLQLPHYSKGRHLRNLTHFF